VKRATFDDHRIGRVQDDPFANRLGLGDVAS
jgi:hypothetical protein